LVAMQHVFIYFLAMLAIIYYCYFHLLTVA